MNSKVSGLTIEVDEKRAGVCKQALASLIPRAQAALENRAFLPESFLFTDVIAPEQQGKSQLVVLREGDEVLYAKRLGKEGYSKFVLKRSPTASDLGSIRLKKTGDSSYMVVGGFYGIVPPKEPWMARTEEEKSRLIHTWQEYGYCLSTNLSHLQLDSLTLTVPEDWK